MITKNLSRGTPASTAPPGARRRRRRPDAARTAPYLLLLPAITVMTAAVGFPWIWSGIVSFTRWNAISAAGPKFSGFANYASILTAGQFWSSLLLTLVLIALTVPAQLVIGFCLAYAVARARHLSRLFQGIYILPLVVVPVMIGLAWRVILDPEYGILPYLWSLLGLPAVGWLTSPRAAIFTVALVEIWRNTSVVFVILLAGIRSVPLEILEAGRIDGASGFGLLWHVVVGSTRRFVVFAAITAIITEIRAFDTVYGLFQSAGPGNGANVLGVYLYDVFTQTFDYGKSAAIAWIMLLLTLALSAWLVSNAFKRVDD